ncbi:hypothetical protein NC653_041794 [Populus alba x Populus x berolinensis]|uniref:SHSP domain-containing protein n=1 Tax=Populus alba x Populus x berolinensis TaxID=444605 RepID=A0AAD6LAC0_9ROSI|nr:hypothetical protein NC653_041794 [Populus alba x Populus x berolinensis]
MVTSLSCFAGRKVSGGRVMELILFLHFMSFSLQVLEMHLCKQLITSNKLFQNLHIPSPSNLIGRVKEKDECYKLRYEVPGVSKEDLKITINDGVLTIKGELKEEEEEGSDGERWSMRSYGCYNYVA